MAGKKINLHHKVQSSTLLEVIVAMVVMIAVFGIAMMILTNIARSSISMQKIKAMDLLNECYYQQLNGLHNDNNQTFGDIRIEWQVSPYQSFINLTQITLTAYDANNLRLAQLKRIIYIK